MIIKIGEVEWHDLKRQVTYAKTGECEHKRLQYIEHGELLKCLDCEKQISAVWALKHFFTQYQEEEERLKAIRFGIEQDRARLVTHKAALAVQNAWRKKHTVPTCPHCHKGILPPDGLGPSSVNPKYYECKPLEMKPNLALVEKTSE
jgi:hypothetical protein